MVSITKTNSSRLDGLQAQFKQQYSKIGNTREQLFHAWRSFHFDKKSENLDSYVTCIMQVSVCLVYGELQVLEVFKKTHFHQDCIGSCFL